MAAFKLKWQRSCNRDPVAVKAETIYYLHLHRQSLSITSLDSWSVKLWQYFLRQAVCSEMDQELL